MDAHLSVHQAPGAPNWSRAETPLPAASFGQAYSHTLVEGVDFWDPEGDAVTVSLIDAPAWLSLKQDSAQPGRWLLQGLPTETSAAESKFRLRAQDASGGTERSVELKVGRPAGPHLRSTGARRFRRPTMCRQAATIKMPGLKPHPFRRLRRLVTWFAKSIRP